MARADEISRSWSGAGEIALTLELAPTAHVTDELRRDVLSSFAQQGFAGLSWEPLRGDPTPRPDIRIADPSLHLVISAIRDATHDAFLHEHAVAVGGALASVRDAHPELPIGVVLRDKDGVRRAAFRLEDGADTIREGMCLLANALGTLASGAIGWSFDDRAWIAL